MDEKKKSPNLRMRNYHIQILMFSFWVKQELGENLELKVQYHF